MQFTIQLSDELKPCPGKVALIWAEGIEIKDEQKSVPNFLAEVIRAAQETGPDFISPDTRKRVRSMLRFGKYRPSGRSKPASEFLLRAALAGELSSINGPVDINNAVSLESGFPASIFDVQLCGHELLLRRGKPGERYVFNKTGQEIDLQDLLVVCRELNGDWQPCGNPVKDSMATKTNPATTAVVAFLFAPADERDQLVSTYAQRFADLLADHCRAAQSGYRILFQEQDSCPCGQAIAQ